MNAKETEMFWRIWRHARKKRLGIKLYISEYGLHDEQDEWIEVKMIQTWGKEVHWGASKKERKVDCSGS